ncbi:NAD(P)-binding protein [Leucogyrophana mollusca]|uniref:NAD(P)-binding protein n=1 Tax=Leucogyrophana mollusca TaxID=85980 RepID=A0ACB8B8R2_9AGAM|nr:NAD(P)-binding protein [Leucogyrophana mollusca]
MPALQSPDASRKVLVSGANGFIGIWVVRTLLEQGYSVRSAVRAEEKGQHLKKMFGGYGDKHEIVVVPDITKEGAFDEAVKGVDAVEHIASPVTFNVEDPYELITPAVNGTVGMLHSVLKHGTSVQRVVITSSTAAVVRDDPNPLEFDENNWNEQCLEILAEGGPRLIGHIKYRASKTLAEKAVWKFWEENRGKITWDIVVLNPPYVFGPTIHDVASPSALNISTLEWHKFIVHPTSSGATNEFLATRGGGWVDVRDLAEAHMLALEKEAAGSKRIIINAGVWKWQDFLDAANAISPPPKLSQPLPVGNPGAGSADPAAIHMLVFKTDRARDIFGLKYHTIAETTEDMLADFESRGW